MPEADDAVVAEAGDLPPDRARLVVGRDAVCAAEDGDDEALLREAVVLREELPREGDGVLLEVVAEAEVAEHLEERVVARGDADVLEVVVLAADADALLARRRARVRRGSLPVKTSLNWTMPAFANISVGSFCGTSGALGTTSWPWRAKKSRNARRTSAEVRVMLARL